MKTLLTAAIATLEWLSRRCFDASVTLEAIAPQRRSIGRGRNVAAQGAARSNAMKPLTMHSNMNSLAWLNPPRQ